MKLEDRLQRLADSLPTGSTVTLNREAVLSLLHEDTAVQRTGDRSPDQTVAAVAALFDRAPSTVRGWIREGRLEAYMFGREYRVTPEALAVFEETVRAEGADEVEALRCSVIDLGTWRSVYDADDE